MKVREILVQEGAILNALKYPFVKALGPIAKSAMGKEQAIEKLATTWGGELINGGKITTKANKIVGKELAADGKVISQATKKAQQIAKDASYAADAEALRYASSQLAKGTINVANAIGYGAPVGAFAKRVWDLNSQLKSGDIDDAEYNRKLQFYIGECLTQMAAIKVAGGALKLGNGILKSIDVLPFGSKLTGLIATLTPAMQASFGVWLATPESMGGGASAFHEWFIGEGFMGEATLARDIFGSWGKKGWDFIAHKVHTMSGGKIPDSPGNPQANPKPEADPEHDISTISGPDSNWDTRSYDSTTGRFK